LSWSTRSLSHEGYLALLRVECVSAPRLRRTAGTLPIGEIRLKVRGPTDLAAASAIMRRHGYFPLTTPAPGRLVQLVHGVNPEDPQTQRQNTLRGSHERYTSTR